MLHRNIGIVRAFEDPEPISLLIQYILLINIFDLSNLCNTIGKNCIGKHMDMKKQILITTTVFIAAMFGGNSANGQTLLNQVNREIAQTRNSIDSVRRAHAVAMTRHLERNADYRYIQENSGSISKLKRENDRLLDYAIELIRRKRPGILILRTPLVFITHRDVPGVANTRGLYRANKRRINEYNRRVAALQPQRQIIKNKCDSAMHAQIDMYQLRLDSLLNRKLELIR